VTGIERTPVPGAKAPQVRHKKPAPFSRPRIDLDGGKAAKREWRTIPACHLQVGDIVPGIGRIFSVDEAADIPGLDEVLRGEFPISQSSWTVTVHGGDKNARVYNGSDLVWAFTTSGEAQ